MTRINLTKKDIVNSIYMQIGFSKKISENLLEDIFELILINIKKQKLSKIRKELDKLDNKLIKIIKKRTNLVKRVLAIKEKKNQIVDQKRINLILKNIKNKSIKNKIDPKITHKIWKNMIYAYIDFERRNFNKKK